MTDAFSEHASAMAHAMRELPRNTQWLLACDTDADGLTAAAVMGRALLRLGCRFTIRPSRAKTTAYYDELLTQEWGALVLLDKGASHAAKLAASGRPVFIVDHHNVDADAATPRMLNPRLAGLDGSRDASASTTSLALALALVGEPAWKWAGIALAGAIGDWQHMGGWQGWNQQVVEEGRSRGVLERIPMPRFIGSTLEEAVRRAQLPGLTDVRGWLVRHELDPDGDVEDLDKEGKTRLVSAVVQVHLAAGLPAPPPTRLLFDADQDVVYQVPLRTLFRMADACGREERHDVGVAWLMGDKAAHVEARACFEVYRERIRDGLDALRKDGAKPGQALQTVWTEKAAYTGMVAGIGMTHVLPDTSRPVAVLAKRSDGLVQISTRGRNEQVQAGLNLGTAVSVAATHVGHEGGGHPVAAGAVIPADKVDAFLEKLDAVLVMQNFRGRR